MRKLKTHCKRGHPLSGDNLYVSKTGYRACRTCRDKRTRDWEANNPERVRETRNAFDKEYRNRPGVKEAANRRSRGYRKGWTPEQRREKSRRGIARAHGLTLEQYDAKLVSQKGICGLCGKPFDVTVPSLYPSLDHDHATGKIRDFCHRRCNAAIGLLQDDAQMAIKAAEYLKRHKEENDGRETDY